MEKQAALPHFEDSIQGYENSTRGNHMKKMCATLAVATSFMTPATAHGELSPDEDYIVRPLHPKAQSVIDKIRPFVAKKTGLAIPNTPVYSSSIKGVNSECGDYVFGCTNGDYIYLNRPTAKGLIDTSNKKCDYNTVRSISTAMHETIHTTNHQLFPDIYRNPGTAFTTLGNTLQPPPIEVVDRNDNGEIDFRVEEGITEAITRDHINELAAQWCGKKAMRKIMKTDYRTGYNYEVKWIDKAAQRATGTCKNQSPENRAWRMQLLRSVTQSARTKMIHEAFAQPRPKC